MNLVDLKKIKIIFCIFSLLMIGSRNSKDFTEDPAVIGRVCTKSVEFISCGGIACPTSNIGHGTISDSPWHFPYCMITL